MILPANLVHAMERALAEHHRRMGKHLRIVDDMLAESEERELARDLSGEAVRILTKEVAMGVKTKKKALKKRTTKK